MKTYTELKKTCFFFNISNILFIYLFRTKKETYKVILKPGNRYYIELYQLSTNQQNALKLGYETRCPNRPNKLLISELAINKANVIYDIPSKSILLILLNI